MGYVDKNLMSGEGVLYRARLHWVVFFGAAIWLILSVILFAVDASTWVFGAVALVVFIALGLAAWINYFTSEFAITSKRLIMKTGWIRRNTVELLHGKIESMLVDQGILGRMLDFGTITVSGTGGTKDPFKKVAAPMMLRKMLYEHIDSQSIKTV